MAPTYDDRKEGMTLSIEEFWRYEPCYVWRDEFEKWYERFINRSYASEKEENTALVFTPILPKDHATYFERTELRKLKLKAPLDKFDEELQIKKIIANNRLSFCLPEFIRLLPVDVTEDNTPFLAFYWLIEEYGLVVYNKVVDGQIVSSTELFRSLRERQRQARDSFDDYDCDFWGTLANERKYTVERDDVATAYDHAGKLEFPWLSIVDNQVSLNVNDHSKIAKSCVFGLPAKAEDYQDAFKQDAWSWQEALCWLKRRLPDKRRLHQLPKFYPTETDMIQRAIKAGRLSADSSSPRR